MGLDASLKRYMSSYGPRNKDLRPITNSHDKEFHYLVADIETSKWVNFICVGLFAGEMFEYYEDYGELFDAIMIWARAFAGDNSNIKWRDNEIEVFKKDDKGEPCLETKTERTLSIPVFVHNGGRYDFNFFMKYIFTNQDPNLTFHSGIPIGSTVLSFKVRYQIKPDMFVEIMFWDSTKLLPFSLANLTEAFNVEHKKLEIEYKAITEVTPELLEYLEHDCRGHYEVLQTFFS